MIGDPQRLQYLEAMGITAWASRYRFANARPSEQGEWQTPVSKQKPAPGERLHALLETSAQPAEAPRSARAAESPAEAGSEASSARTSTPALSRARALLEDPASGASADDPSASESTRQPEAAPAESSTDAMAPPAEALADPLRFTLSLAVIGGRWWLMLPGERPLSAAGQALLEQMLRSVSLPPSWSTVSRLTWPLMEVPAADPTGEAREGIQVFCAGQARRHDLVIDGAIVIGDEVWAPLSSDSIKGGHWACHMLPHPDDLLSSAKGKRDCWPRLQAMAQAWQAEASNS